MQLVGKTDHPVICSATPPNVAAMRYNQVQSFQINDHANHYEDIEITGYRALYSKSIAGRGEARLISWLGTAGQSTALINQCLTIILEYINLLNFYWQGTASFCLGLLLATSLKQRHSTNLQDFSLLA